jgi:antitoxin component HigA of HigAB toxin-antitoxin module
MRSEGVVPFRPAGVPEFLLLLVAEVPGQERLDMSPAEVDYLDVPGDLMEKYEDERVEMPQVSDAQMVRSLMEEKEVSQADVVRGMGISKTDQFLVLNGKRDLTREHFRALSKYLGVIPAAFLGPI